jgi:hypothetical protein
MSLVLRGLATKTSWPHSSSTLLTHGECVPASMATRIGGRSEAKRRLRASGVVRSLPSSIASPPSVSMRHRDSCICRPSPIRLSSVGGCCYHHPWADPPSWAVRARMAFADPLGYCVSGGSAFSSHLPRRALLRGWVNKLRRTGQSRHCGAPPLLYNDREQPRRLV